MLAVSLVLVACEGVDGLDESVDDGREFPAQGEVADRTVLVYMVADNNLGQKGFGNSDVLEMKKGMAQLSAQLKRHNNLLVYWDDMDYPSLYRVVTDETGGTLELLKSYDKELTSTQGAVIESVIADAFGKYPANSYGFVYWSHGDGWIPAVRSASGDKVRWIGADWNNYTLDTYQKTDISVLARALDTAPKKIDFLLFDACYMLSVEVAYELRDVTKYIIACPAETPGPGAPYDELLPHFFASNHAAEGLAAAYYENYAKNYNPTAINTNNYWTGGVSMGVVDCSKLEALAAATAQYLPNKKMSWYEVLGNMTDCDKRPGSSHIGYFDMHDMMKALMSADDFAQWEKSFAAVQVYWNTTDENYSSYSGGSIIMKNVHGLTHYMPMTDNLNQAIVIANHRTGWYNAADIQRVGW